MMQTVGELRNALAGLPSDMKLGVSDVDGEITELQFAGVMSHEMTGEQYFLIVPNGGYYLFPEEDPLDAQ
jgi:hypothetical protein